MAEIISGTIGIRGLFGIGIMNINRFEDDKQYVSHRDKLRYNYQENTSGPFIDVKYNSITKIIQREIMLEITNGLGYHTLDNFNEQYSHAPDKIRLRLKLKYMDELTSRALSSKLMNLDVNCFLKNKYHFNPQASQEEKRIARVVETRLSLDDNIGLTFDSVAIKQKAIKQKNIISRHIGFI